MIVLYYVFAEKAADERVFRLDAKKFIQEEICRWAPIIRGSKGDFFAYRWVSDLGRGRGGGVGFALSCLTIYCRKYRQRCLSGEGRGSLIIVLQSIIGSTYTNN